MTRHLLEVDDLTPDELIEVLDLRRVRRDLAAGAGKVERRRPRTSRSRRSAPATPCEMAVVQLGGHPVTIFGPTRSVLAAASRSRTSPAPGRLPRRASAPACSTTACSSAWRRSRRCRSSTCCPTTAHPLPGAGRPAHHPPASSARSTGRTRRLGRRLQQRGPLAGARWPRCSGMEVRIAGPPGYGPSDERPRPPPGTRRGAVRDEPPDEAVDGRRRRLHRRLGLDGPGGRGRRAAARRSRASRSMTDLMAAAGARRHLPALPPRPPGRGGQRVGRRRAREPGHGHRPHNRMHAARGAALVARRRRRRPA